MFCDASMVSFLPGATHAPALCFRHTVQADGQPVNLSRIVFHAQGHPGRFRRITAADETPAQDRDLSIGQRKHQPDSNRTWRPAAPFQSLA
jgi:predicted pyridoxine 5'-phosphate oxidase superfamily flavin-nucleotide-binding protein